MNQLGRITFEAPNLLGPAATICSLFILSFPFHGLANDTNTPESEQSPGILLTNILIVRAELNDELQKGFQKKDAEAPGATKNTIVKQARQLNDLSGRFLERFPTNENFLQVNQQQIYGAVISGMLHKENAAVLGNVVDYISSCLFEPDAVRSSHVSTTRAVQLQYALESAMRMLQ